MSIICNNCRFYTPKLIEWIPEQGIFETSDTERECNRYSCDYQEPVEQKEQVEEVLPF
jgi:hypothetical protein